MSRKNLSSEETDSIYGDQANDRRLAEESASMDGWSDSSIMIIEKGSHSPSPKSEGLIDGTPKMSKLEKNASATSHAGSDSDIIVVDSDVLDETIELDCSSQVAPSSTPLKRRCSTDGTPKMSKKERNAAKLRAANEMKVKLAEASSKTSSAVHDSELIAVDSDVMDVTIELDDSLRTARSYTSGEMSTGALSSKTAEAIEAMYETPQKKRKNSSGHFTPMSNNSVHSFTETPSSRGSRSASATPQRKSSWKENLSKARKMLRYSKEEKFGFDAHKMKTKVELIENVRVFDRYCQDEIRNNRRRVIEQLKFPIGGPKNMSSAEKKKRKLCRMPVHCWHQDGKKYQSMVDIWPKLHAEFMNPFDVDDKMIIEEVVNDMITYIERKERLEKEKEALILNDPGAESILDEIVSIDGDEVQDKEGMKEIENQLESSAEGEDSDDEVEKDNIEDGSKSLSSINKPKRSRRTDDGKITFNKDEQEFLEDAHGDDVMRHVEEGDGITRAIIGHYTSARRCDADCPKIDEVEAAAIYDLILNNANKTWGKWTDLTLSGMVYLINGKSGLVSEWLKKYEDCFQGIRSLLKRYRELDQLVKLSFECMTVIENGNVAELSDFIKQIKLSDTQWQKFLDMYAAPKSQDHHKQDYVDKKFGHLHLAFKEEMRASIPTIVCDICSEYRSSKNVTKERVRKFRHILPKKFDHVNNDALIIACRQCKSKMGDGTKTPARASRNNFEPDECPEELLSLNVIESMLIAKARPNMKTIYLKAVSGKSTQMRATNGILVCLPTDIEATVHHVAKTLPSAECLNLQVTTSWGKEYVVSMDKVIKSLEWLIRNNPEYYDVEIDRNFHFELNKNVVFENRSATQADADALITDTPNYMLTQLEVEEQAIQNVAEKNDVTPAYKKYKLKKNLYVPIRLETATLDLQMFPKLYPRGQGGLNAKRVTSLKASQYVRKCLLHSDRRWGQNSGWLCYSFGRKQQLAISSIQGIRARVKSGTFAKDYNTNDDRTQKLMQSAFCKMRGYPPYWQGVKYCLRSHVATFGSPTWFLTLNPNTTGWPDLHELYTKVMGVKVDEKNIDAMITKDPELFARYWRARVDSFWQKVILNKDGPLGSVTHYFYRVEYQHRGTQHLHCVIWSKDRPTEKHSVQEICDFIDAHVTARLPDAEREKELYELIENNQKHWDKHSKTCRRLVKFRTKLYKTKCRFGFPRPIIRRTVFFNDEKKCRIPGLTQRPYTLARTPEEVMVNDYNPAISRIWEGNTDLQFIPAGCKDIVNYITAYMTKGEKSKKRDKQEWSRYDMFATSQSKAIFQVALNMCENREVGLLEVVDDLAGYPNFAFDTAHVFIPNDVSTKRLRILRSSARLKESDVVHEFSWLDDYYPNRCAEMEFMSLYNMMTNFEITTPSDESTTRRNRPMTQDERNMSQFKMSRESYRAEEDDLEDYISGDDNDFDMDDKTGHKYSEDSENKKLENDGRYHRDCSLSPFYSHPMIGDGGKIPIPGYEHKAMRKIKQRVGRFFLPKMIEDDVESGEDFYRRLVLMFVPWREEATILEDNNCESYLELWKKYKKLLRRKFSGEACDDLEKLVSGYTRLRKEEADWEKRMEQARAAKLKAGVDEEAEEAIEIQPRLVDEDKYKSDYEKLNSIQKEIVDHALAVIAEQHEIRLENVERAKAGLKLLPFETLLHILVAGVAGTGKSFVINILADALTLLYVLAGESGTKPACLLSAPTGIAALAINGNTIHSLLGIEVVQVGHFSEELFQPLSAQRLEELRVLFENVRLLIIDEISMVANVIVMKIHLRLREVSGVNAPFGGYNVMMFGDLLQLPPVKANHPFDIIRSYEMRRIFGTMSANINLWNILDYRELTQNMRQGDDLALAEMFGRIRCGAHNESDIRRLKTRLIPAKDPTEPTLNEMAIHFEGIRQKDPTAMALFATNAEVDAFNQTIIEMIAHQTVTIDARDDVDEQAMREMERWKGSKKRKIWMSYSLKEADNEADLAKLRRQADCVVENRLFVDNVMHGGLPFQLIVSVGSRVMLRRNINIGEQLVNGACGTVRAIEMDANHTEVSFITVEFDSGIIRQLPRLKAQFLKKENIMSRSQFPLVLAYGATIHKAQGLTLNNVVLRSRNIFADGQFYVGVSRVRSFDGLHLAGLHAEKITVDLAALVECNRLRKKVNLPVLQTAEGLKKLAAKQAIMKKNKEKFASIVNDTEVKKHTKKVDMTPTNTRQQRILYERRKTDEDVEMCIPLTGRKESLQRIELCERVLLGVNHVLSMMEFVFERIQKCEEMEEIEKDALAYLGLRGCLMKEQNDVVEMAERCEKMVDVKSMRAIVEYILEQALPIDIFDEFARHCPMMTRCLKCKEVDYSVIIRPIVWLTENETLGNLSKILHRKLSSFAKITGKCQMLRKDGTRDVCGGVLEMKCGVGTKGGYLIVGNEFGWDSKYEAASVDPVHIDTSRFLLVGAVSLGAQNSDCVEAWYQSPTAGWIHCDSNTGVIEYRSAAVLERIHFTVWVEKPKVRLNAVDKRNEEKMMSVFEKFDQIVDEDQDDFQTRFDDEGLVDDEANNNDDDVRVKNTAMYKSLVSNREGNTAAALKVQMDSSANISVSQSGRAVQVQRGEFKSCFLLMSGGTDCFLNTSINILFNCLDIRRQIQDETRGGQLAMNLRLIFGRRQNSSQFVRQLMPDNFNYVESNGELRQEDVAECLEELIRMLDNEGIDISSLLKRSTRFEYCSNTRCRNHNRNSVVVRQAFTNLHMAQHDSFEHLLALSIDNTVQCHVCKIGKLRDHEVVSSIGTYHLVFIQTLEFRLDSFRVRERIDAFGHVWDLIAFSSYVGSGAAGHYTSWTKESNSHWINVSDAAYCGQADHRSLDLNQHVATALLLRRRDANIDRMQVATDSNVDAAQYLASLPRRTAAVLSIVTPPVPSRTSSLSPQKPTSSTFKPLPVRRRLVPPNDDNEIEMVDIRTANEDNAFTLVNDVSTRGKSGKKVIEAGRNPTEEEIRVYAPLVLLLMNPKNNCFLNVCITLLYAITLFRNRMKMNRTMMKKNEAPRLLADLFVYDKINDASELRFKLDKSYHEGEHDIGAALDNLLEILAQDGATFNEFSSIVIRGEMCLFGCQLQSEETEEPEVFTRTFMTGNANFEDMINAASTEIHDCQGCRRPKSLMINRRVKQTGPYHIVINERDRSQFFNDFKTTEPISMFNSFWYVVAFGEYDPPLHYRSWIKTATDWVCISDDKVRRLVKPRDMNLKNYQVRILVFWKLPQKEADLYQNQKDERTEINRRKLERIVQENKMFNAPAVPAHRSIIKSSPSVSQKQLSSASRISIEDSMPASTISEALSRIGGDSERGMTSRRYLLLLPGNNNCFLNVALNMLFACKKLRKQIIKCGKGLCSDYRNRTELGAQQLKMAAEIFEGTTQSASELKETMAEFRNNQKDAASAADYLCCNMLDRHNPDIWSSIRIDITTIESCSQCEYEKVKPSRPYPFTRVRVSKKETFELVWKLSQKRKVVGECRLCKAKSLTCEKKIETTNQQMIVFIDRDDGMQEVGTFKSFNVDASFELAGSNWSLRAFAEHVFLEEGLGHYFTWVRIGDRWLQISDDTVTKKRSIVENMSRKTITIIVLDKIN